MTPTKEQIEALAVALHRVVEERRYIDLDATDLAFGGKEPFVDIAVAILTALDGWTLVKRALSLSEHEALTRRWRELGVHRARCLAFAKITPEEARRMSDDELLNVRNAGKSTLVAIRAALAPKAEPSV